MIKTQYAICASRIIRDSDSNRISAIDILDDGDFSSFPITFSRIELVWTLSRDKEDPEVPDAGVTLSVNGRSIFQTPLNVNFQGSHATRAVLRVGGIAVDQPGLFKVEWTISGATKAEYWVNFRLIPTTDQ